MSTSGTYAFNPSLGELVLYAHNIAQVRNTAITQEHMYHARMASNMLLANWSNRGVNLWAVDLITTTLTEGVATYPVDADTVMILDAYITIPSGTSNTDRIILPVSRTEYASYPNKEQQGFPTVYWFDRLLSPTITLWPVPDGSTNVLKYYRVRRLQDSNLTNAENVEIPYLWMDAFAYGLAHRISEIWNPQISPMLLSRANDSYAVAAEQNVEYAQQYISPQIQGYFR